MGDGKDFPPVQKDAVKRNGGLVGLLLPAVKREACDGKLKGVARLCGGVGGENRLEAAGRGNTILGGSPDECGGIRRESIQRVEGDGAVLPEDGQMPTVKGGAYADLREPETVATVRGRDFLRTGHDGCAVDRPVLGHPGCGGKASGECKEE